MERLTACLLATATLLALAGSAVADNDHYDPLAYARQAGLVLANLEAGVPSMCYTKTDGVSNPCWTCHSIARYPNELDDWTLQEEYAFSDEALTNHWSNLFIARRHEAARITDAECLTYIRQDNYAPLLKALRNRRDYLGYRPDLDLDAGFDDDGFANDGSRWRALRFKPFLGTFWPTNGSTDDVFVRLPARFSRDAAGRYSRAVHKLNYAILEAAVCSDPSASNADVQREIEPVDEFAGGLDLDADGELSVVSRVRGLPACYVGAAADVPVRRDLYPAGTEFLHSVRYVDPDEPGMIARRMKELRYSRKTHDLSDYIRSRAYEAEGNEKDAGNVPIHTGSPEVGLMNAFGWQFQAFIEDSRGRLRLQTHEEHHFCMGCHSSLGVTVDSTFTMTRKVPGAAGWRYQDLRGIPDVPQAGHDAPEILTYFQRVGGGDEFRANEEILSRFFVNGVVDEDSVRAAPDITSLIMPSRERAIALNKAYMALVRSQRFDLGRDTLLVPPANVHQAIDNGDTGLKAYKDGSLFLSWPEK